MKGLPDRLIDQLFGSAMEKGTVGLLSLNFRTLQLEMATFGKGSTPNPLTTWKANSSGI
jgi:hypothetical protein